ncbi:hypothetical protein CU633_00435 [Bacillus sp. V3-13]|uniref:hypothetical protein n=1 Tax=Bacillus sp. V3-13 TaxID=2053728 RepID=UPI000C7928AC|nr:hypothetical protein [Bacillus sp. V3-13]PLR79241.1 hypothetical protein CU633_00435 [Bacillus sp. V3-13]
MEKERRNVSVSAVEETGDQERKDLNGLKPEESLLSVNFATTENPYLNEHNNTESKGNSEP